MKRVGILLIGMMLLAIVSAATAQGNLFVSASGVGDTGGNGDFEKFWGILGNVSALVVEVNSSPNYNNVHDLIRWTRLGEENAGNISALVWKSLLDLKSSGVKLHYTSEELRSLASNISRNGLPSETVQALKEQGWSDDQINALVSYIRDHSNDIVGDFDLGAYLEAFSDSFIEVGKKYASYETWAFEKYYWHNALSNPPSGNVVSNPYVSAYDVSKLDYAASTKNADGLLSTVKSLRDDIEFVITDVAIAYYTNGGVKFQTTSLSSSGKTIKTYYWANALKAYRLVSELYTIAVALKNGNSNEDLWDLVRQYKRELDSILAVKLVSTTFIPAPRPGPSPMPIPLSLDSFSPASYTPGDEPRLVITDVKVIKTDADFIKGLVKYRVRVDYYVYGGAVMIDRVKFNDGSESKVLSMDAIVYTGPGSVESPEFIAPVGNALQASVSGIVKIRYRSVTSPGGDTPNSKPGDPVETTSVQAYTPADYSTPTAPVLVMEGYHGTIDLVSAVDPGKVDLKIQAIKMSEEKVKYVARISNSNSVPIRGTLTFYFTILDGDHLPRQVVNYTRVVIMPNSQISVDLSTVEYPGSGTYGFTGILDFGGFEKEYSGEVTVLAPVGGGELKISKVEVGPVPIFETDSVEFNVTVVNSYRSAKDISLKLIVDGKYGSELAYWVNGTVEPNSMKTFTLYWDGLEGSYTYRIELYSYGGYVDSRVGEFIVLPYSARDELKVLGRLELSPSTAYIGKTEKVAVKIKLWDTRSKSVDIWEGHDVKIVDERGVVWWPYKGRAFEEPRDVQTGEGYMYTDGMLRLHYGFNATLSTLLPVVNHNVTFYLEVDGHKVAASKLTVIDDNPVRAVMKCDPAVVSLGGSARCKVSFNLRSPDMVTLHLMEIDFGGKKVWPNGPGSVWVEAQRVTLSPTNMQENLTVTITINDTLANYYFGKPIYRTYIDKFAGYSYLIEAKFSELNYPVSDVITVVYKDTRDTLEKSIDYGSTIGEIISTVQLVFEGSNPVGWFAFALTSLPKLGKASSEIQWIFEWGVDGFPQENDNNAVVGG